MQAMIHLGGCHAAVMQKSKMNTDSLKGVSSTMATYGLVKRNSTLTYKTLTLVLSWQLYEYIGMPMDMNREDILSFCC